jgi:hypothetical protein
MPNIAALLGVILAAGLLSSAATRAEMLPLPQTDYEATLKVPDAGSAMMRHHDGVLLFQYAFDELTHTMLIDLDRRIATTWGLKDGKKIAVEGPAALFGALGPSADRGATIIGSGNVAGEVCDIWRRAEPNPRWPQVGAKERVASDSCITKDGILLRTMIDGQLVLEVTKLDRMPQDPALFVVPADYTIHPYQHSE